MDEKKILRINELSKKSRESGLNESEKKEQAELRAEYLAAVRRNLKAQLDQIRPGGAGASKDDSLPPS